jgi:hypothetical protein
VGIHIGTRNERLEPSGARCLALAVEPDGAHVVVYMAAVAAARVLPDLESNGQAALSFARPVDERACQVKGIFAGAREASEAERERIASQWELFRANLEAIGIPRAGNAAWPTWPCVAVRLRVTQLFEQTPRPGTGGPLA